MFKIFNISNASNAAICVYTVCLTGLTYIAYQQYKKTTPSLNTLYVVHKNIDVRYSDVIGCEDILPKIKQYIDAFINNKNEKVKLPAGYIFEGPPGTGKTFFAKAIAGEINVPFIEINTKIMTEIEPLFKHINKKYGKCVVFVDEADKFLAYYATELLTMIDGISRTTDIFLILAGNNVRKNNHLPSSLFRAGRLSTTITFVLPVIKDRLAFIKRKFPHLSEEETKQLVEETTSMTIADLEEIYNKILYDLELNVDTVTLEQIKTKLDNKLSINLFGSKPTMSEKVRSRIIVHETGHTIVSYVLKNSRKPEKICIDLSKYETGFTKIMFDEVVSDVSFNTFTDICSEICVLFGGCEAEVYFYGEHSDGVYNDFTKIDSCIKNILRCNMFDDETWTYDEVDLYYRSEETKNKVNKFIKCCRSVAHDIIEKYQNKFEVFQTRMQNVDSLECKDIESILGEEIKDTYEVTWYDLMKTFDTDTKEIKTMTNSHIIPHD
jgi:cell division protease FtsH